MLKLTLYILDALSLKDKRRILRQLLDQVSQRFNVSICEVDDRDSWQKSTLGVACVARSTSEAHEVLNKILSLVEDDPRVEVGNVELETW